MKAEYLNIEIAVTTLERRNGTKALSFQEFVDKTEGNIELLHCDKNKIMLIRDREALGSYQRFFKDVTNFNVVWFEQEFLDVFFDNEVDGIVVEKTLVSEENYTTVKMVISN